MPPVPRNPGPRTYAEAGVDVDLRAAALARLLTTVRYRGPPGRARAPALSGHYAGLARVGRETVALTTDTVGTKVLLAEALGRWEPIGEDAVAVNVNDLAAVGAQPVGLVDVISCRSPDPAVFEAIGRGLDRGLRAARCVLLGGETAVVPELVQSIDVGGTALGCFPRGRRPVTGERIRPGDALVGLPSTGFQLNGYTLVRSMLSATGTDLAGHRPGSSRTLGEELLEPSRIYVAASEAVAGLPGVVGLAHISGGGVRNLVRLRRSVAYVLDGWPAPAGLFGWVAERGGFSPSELYQTFNMGIGFVVVARPAAEAAVLRRLAAAGYPDARRVGHVESGRGVSVPGAGVSYSGYA